MNDTQVHFNSTFEPSRPTCPISQSLALWLLVGSLAIIVILIVFIVVKGCRLCRRGTATLTDTKTESFKIQVPFYAEDVSVDRIERIAQINDRIEAASRNNISTENLHTRGEWHPPSSSSLSSAKGSTPLTPIPVPTPSVPLTPAALRTPAAIPEGKSPAKRKHPEIPQVTPLKVNTDSPRPECDYDDPVDNVEIRRISEAVEEEEPEGEMMAKKAGHIPYVNCRRAFGPKSQGEHDYYNAVRMNMLNKHL